MAKEQIAVYSFQRTHFRQRSREPFSPLIGADCGERTANRWRVSAAPILAKEQLVTYSFHRGEFWPSFTRFIGANFQQICSKSLPRFIGTIVGKGADFRQRAVDKGADFCQDFIGSGPLTRFLGANFGDGQASPPLVSSALILANARLATYSSHRN